LIVSFAAIIAVSVLLSSVVGIVLINTTIVRQAHQKVRMDLNSAREVYSQEGEALGNAVTLASQRITMADAADPRRRQRLAAWLEEARQREHLDILTLTDHNGRVLVRARNPQVWGDQYNSMMVYWVLWSKQAVVATEVVSSDELAKESPDLAARARTTVTASPRAIIGPDTVEARGMMIKAAAPLLGAEGKLQGILYGGLLLNHNDRIVDRAQNILYRGQKFRGRDAGATTIFLDDRRIATTITTAGDERATGTRCSPEVYDQVMGRGIRWVGRVYVVNGWYIAAYEPIRNINGKAVGMLYVGMLEAPFLQLRDRVVLVFAAVALLTAALLWFTATVTGERIARPVRALVRAAEDVGRGNLSRRVDARSDDEIGQLARSFNAMAAGLQAATEERQNMNRVLERRVAEKTAELQAAQDVLVQTEKLSSLGKMAAGIAHEINNPLTSILLNAHLLEERLPDNPKLLENLHLIIDETTRCSAIVKGLLDFSRQGMQQRRPADINDIVEKTLQLCESQIRLQNVRVITQLDKNLPTITIDAAKIRQVFANIVINAVDAMAGGGTLTVTSRFAGGGDAIEVLFSDTGGGMSRDTAAKIFDPFFSTKGQKGTGLGLAISYGIIRQHGGTIEADSREEHGTTMTVTLPAGDKPPEEEHHG
jgi:two-component system NtrC family sensor kinase